MVLKVNSGSFKVQAEYVELAMKFLHPNESFLDWLARYDTPLEEVIKNGKRRWIRDENKYLQKAKKEKENIEKLFVCVQKELLEYIEKKTQKEKELNKKQYKVLKKQKYNTQKKELLRKQKEEEEELNNAILNNSEKVLEESDCLERPSSVHTVKGDKFIYIEGDLPCQDSQQSLTLFTFVQNMKHSLTIKILKKYKEFIDTIQFPEKLKIKPFLQSISCGAIPEKPSVLYKSSRETKSLLMLIRCVYFLISRVFIMRRNFQKIFTGMPECMNINTIMQNFFTMCLEGHFSFTLKICLNELKNNKKENIKILELIDLFEEIELFFLEVDYPLFRCVFPLPTLLDLPSGRNEYLKKLEDLDVQELFLNWSLLGIPPPTSTEYYKKNQGYFGRFWKTGQIIKNVWVEAQKKVQGFYEENKTMTLKEKDIEYIQKMFGKDPPFCEGQTFKDLQSIQKLERCLFQKIKKEDEVSALTLLFVTSPALISKYFL